MANLYYPKHLYDEVRVKVANTYFKREFRKYFHSLRDEKIWGIIDGDIDNWFTDTEFSGVNGPRDFWDGFFGFATGFKLKNGLLEIITAENVAWTEEELPLDDFLTTGGNMLYIDERLSSSRLSAQFLRDFFSKDENKDLAQKWLREFEQHEDVSAERDHFPITVEEQQYNNKTILATYDGNRRLVKAVLSGNTTISAYVARYTSSPQKPQNYWIPTSFLIQMVVMAKKLNTNESFQATLHLLQAYSKQSESGTIELKKRVLLGSSDIVKRLRAELGFGE